MILQLSNFGTNTLFFIKPDHKRVDMFLKALEIVFNSGMFDGIKIILTNFAEKGITKDAMLRIEKKISK